LYLPPSKMDLHLHLPYIPTRMTYSLKIPANRCCLVVVVSKTLNIRLERHAASSFHYGDIETLITLLLATLISPYTLSAALTFSCPVDSSHLCAERPSV
jgi:hypothetical protein